MKINPILTSCPDLIKTFALFHLGEKTEVEYLIDVWLACVPEINIKQKAILEKLPYEGYDPRTDNITRRWVFGITLFKWVKHISNKRGFPLEDFQIEAILKGEASYGY